MFFARSAANDAAGPKSRFAPNAPIEIAMDGTFESRPSIAAATVPEYVMSSPMFDPRFIPETTRSGFCGRKPSTASRTQSVGDPSLMYAGCPLRSWVAFTRKGRRSEEHTSELQSRFDLV